MDIINWQDTMVTESPLTLTYSSEKIDFFHSIAAFDATGKISVPHPGCGGMYKTRDRSII